MVNINPQINNKSKHSYSATDFALPIKNIILFFSLFILCFTTNYLFSSHYNNYQSSIFLFLFSFLTLFICSLGILFFFFNPRLSEKSNTLTLPLTILLICIQALNIPNQGTGVSLTDLLTLNNVVYFFVMIFIGPVYEEVFFRGCVFGTLCTLSNKFGGNLVIPALGTSLIFSVYHSQYTTISAYSFEFMVSIILTIIRIRTKGLIGPMLAHASLNLSAILFLCYILI